MSLKSSHGRYGSVAITIHWLTAIIPLSAVFVRHPRYGTRCSTVLLAGHDRRTVVAERRYDSAGRISGATRHEFRATGTSA